MSALCGIACASIDDLGDHLRKDADTTPLRVLPVDLDLADRRDHRRDPHAEPPTQQASAADAELAEVLSELRLVKDAFELDELREACRQTADSFAAVVADAARGGPPRPG